MKKSIWIAAVVAGVLAAQDIRVIEDQKKLEVMKSVEGARFGEKMIEMQKVVLNGKSFEFVTGVMEGPVVKNAPYAAEAVTETTQKLFDGNEIVRKSSTKQFRDSAGRERREESMGAVLITDPVEKVRFAISPETKSFEKMPYRVPQVFIHTKGDEGEKDGPFVAQNVTVEGRELKKAKFFLGVSGGWGEPKEEDLGTRIVEGVQAQGSRSTQIIPAGDIGNLRPIEIVDERWFSPDLQLTVMTRHSDPREGETVFRLTNIQRIEQVRSLFEIPAGYTVHDAAMARELERQGSLEERKRVEGGRK